MPTNPVLTLIIGFLAGLFFVFLFRKLSLRYNVLMVKGVPIIGGLAILLAFYISLLEFYHYKFLPPEVKGILFGSFFMLLFGLFDDLIEFSVISKIIVQLIAAGILVLFGVRTRIIYIGELLNIIITFVWVIGIANAFNHLDIMDGLAGSVSLIISLSFMLISFLNNDAQTAILTLALSGAILAFLIYNLPPARVYIGNSGSHFLGFVLASIAIMISYAPWEKRAALLSPLLILGLPIFDTAFLIFARLSKSKSPFKKSDDHPALRFLTRGYSKKKALLTLCLCCLFFSSSGILLSQVSNIGGAGIIGMAAVFIFILTKKIAEVKV